MDNYEKYFDLIEGNLKILEPQDTIAFDFRNLVLTYYEKYIGEVDICVKSKFFGLINYCLEGRNLQEAINYKSEKDYEFLKLISKDKYKLLNNTEGKILQDIYNKYKNNSNDWNLFKKEIKQFSLM